MNAIDPVCGMSVDTGSAAATEKYAGQSFYFCSAQCCDKFKANPAQYAESPTGKREAFPGQGSRHH